jgi:hypothetical protein
MLHRILKSIPIINKLIRNSQPMVLGRWKLDECPIKTEKKAHWANEDHCGPCGYSQLQNHVNNKTKEKYEKTD